MTRALLLQLPIPQLNYGRQTGNIPLGAACLKQSVGDIPGAEVTILPESTVSYLGDQALLEQIQARQPDVVGFSIYCWNLRRSLYLAEKLKEAHRCRIVFGGPEVTPDNALVRSAAVDFLVFGEGETVFRRLLVDASFWYEKAAAASAGPVFRRSASPYIAGLLEPEIENLVLLETQRGCPFHCGYCYYSKSRNRLAVKDETLLLEAVRWAAERRIAELYLLDPTINARPGLKKLLEKIQAINHDGALSLISEIRVDQLDTHLADLFAAAGFRWFECGLQSTNPEALRLMNRPTDLARFLKGASLLKERHITPGIDLIAGLPGDDLDGFRRTVDFVVDNGLHEDVQVFPLAVLPGTDFRANSSDLGLKYAAEPPYPVISTAGFTPDDLLLAFDYAETSFDVCLYPMPDLDIAWRNPCRPDGSPSPDHHVSLGGGTYIAKLVLLAPRPLHTLHTLAEHLTHPYQIYIGPDLEDPAYTAGVLEILTKANPFTTLEIIFIAPKRLPDTNRLLGAVNLARPHFLDLEQRFLFSEPGNRAVLFTLVSHKRTGFFNGDMQRQVYWWEHPQLPEISDLQHLTGLDGILVDSACPVEDLITWQEHFKVFADEFLHIGFADVALQKRWLMLTEASGYVREQFDAKVRACACPEKGGWK